MGSGDHVAFDVVGIPAPHFAQDTRHQFIEFDGLEVLQRKYLLVSLVMFHKKVGSKNAGGKVAPHSFSTFKTKVGQRRKTISQINKVIGYTLSTLDTRFVGMPTQRGVSGPDGKTCPE
jgi:hypothetical protein